MLRTALNVSWGDYITNKDLYGHLPKVSSKIREGRIRVAGDCVRHKEEEASKLVLWQPQHGQTKRGRPKTTYMHNLLENSGFPIIGELRTAMLDQSD